MTSCYPVVSCPEVASSVSGASMTMRKVGCLYIDMWLPHTKGSIKKDRDTVSTVEPRRSGTVDATLFYFLIAQCNIMLPMLKNRSNNSFIVNIYLCVNVPSGCSAVAPLNDILKEALVLRGNLFVKCSIWEQEWDINHCMNLHFDWTQLHMKAVRPTSRDLLLIVPCETHIKQARCLRGQLQVPGIQSPAACQNKTHPEFNSHPGATHCCPFILLLTKPARLHISVIEGL